MSIWQLFKSKVQLNKSEIYMNVTFSFHSSEGALSYAALFFWVTRKFTDKSTRSQVNSRTGQLVD